MRDTPLALEAICLKSMSLKPADRYHSPRKLADDLERWLGVEPVLARRETWSEQLSRLERKHRTLVRVSMLSLVLITLLSSIAAYWISQERDRNAQLAVAESKAKTEAQNAERFANTARNDALGAKADADRERGLANEKANEATQKATELQVQLAKSYFRHGVEEYKVGRMFEGGFDIAAAWMLLPKDHELRSAYESVSMDRSLQGGRMAPFQGGQWSPDRSIFISRVNGGYQINDRRTMKPVGALLVGLDPRMYTEFQFTPDNQRVLAFLGENTVRVWNANTGAEIGQWHTHNLSNASNNRAIGPTTIVSPQSDLAASRCSDNSVRIWEIETGIQRGDPLKHGDFVTLMRFSPDGQRLATTSWGEQESHLWNTQTGAAVGVPLRHEKAVYGLLFSPDGKHLLSSSADRTIRDWNATTGDPIGEPIRTDSEEHLISFYPDGQSFAAGFDIPGGKFKGFLQIRKFPEGTRMGEPIPNDRLRHSVEFSPDGSRLLNVSHEGNAALWDAKTGLPVGESFQTESHLEFDSDGTRLLGNGHTVQVFPPAPTLGPAPTGDIVRELRITSNGERVRAAVGHSIRVWNTKTLEVVGELTQEDRVIISFAVSKDEQSFVTGTECQSGQDFTAFARIRNAATGELVVPPLRHPHKVMDVAFHPDGTLVATACFDGGLRLWSTKTGEMVGEAFADSARGRGEFQKRPAAAVAFRPDGRQLAFGSSEYGNLWSVSPLKLTHQFSTLGYSSSSPNAIDYSPDGKRVVTVYSDRTARIWDTTTGERMGDVMRHQITAVLFDAAFSPDGAVIAKVADGMEIKFWDAWTGVPVRETFACPQVSQIAFTPDGNQMISGGLDRNLRVWDVTPDPRPKDISDMLTMMNYQPGQQRLAGLPNPSARYSYEERNTIREEWESALQLRQMRRCRQQQHTAAAEAFDREDWFAAEFHLRQLLKAQPELFDLQKRYQYARRRLAQLFAPAFSELNSDEYQ